MNTLEINKKVQQKLHEFHNVETISTSDNWEFSLQQKLTLLQPEKSNFTTNYAIIMLVLLFLNIGFFVYSYKLKTEESTNVSSDFRMVSKELLLTSNN